MLTLGYALSSEEHLPRRLVDVAVQAEKAGFRKLWISDHFHPWNDEQGQSPFVWSVIGGIAMATSQIEVYTAVTCPTIRIHPAVIAQAAATCASMLDGRFGLGIGSGEALNEHIFGDAWPSAAVRLEMLEESVEVMEKLWTGEVVSHRGKHHTVEHARIVARDAVADSPHGPDPAAYVEQIRAYAEAGYDELYLHQIGTDQEGFIRFVERELLPALAGEVTLG